jgi:hypothetical protein
MMSQRRAFCACLVALSACQVYERSLLGNASSLMGGTGGAIMGTPALTGGERGASIAAGGARSDVSAVLGGESGIANMQASAGGEGGESGILEGDGGQGPQTQDLDLVDDMEDANQFIVPASGRAGAWYSFADSKSAAKVTIEAGLLRGESKYNAHLTSIGFAEYGGMGFALNSNGTPRAYDASAYRGVELWVRVATGTVDVAHLAISDRFTHPGGQECDPGVPNGSEACFDDWLAPLLGLTGDWQRFEVTWMDLHQQGWGHAGGAQIDIATLFEVQLQIGAAADVDVWVDDVALLRR